MSALHEVPLECLWEAHELPKVVCPEVSCVYLQTRIMPVVGVPVITWFIQRAYKFMKYQCGKRTVVFMKTEWNT